MEAKNTQKRRGKFEQHTFAGVYSTQRGRRTFLFTRSLAPGMQVYGEKIVRHSGKEYRQWDPKRSKLAAAILNGLNQLGLAEGQSALYLGASSGTTVSHVSDILGSGGMIFAVESSATMARELVFLADERPNIFPIHANANHPENYQHRVLHVDFIYQDIAQRNQVDIFLKNVAMFLKPNAFCVLCVKARSIDITKHPKEIFKQARAELEKELLVVDARDLSPFQKDHIFFVCKRK